MSPTFRVSTSYSALMRKRNLFNNNCKSHKPQHLTVHLLFSILYFFTFLHFPRLCSNIFGFHDCSANVLVCEFQMRRARVESFQQDIRDVTNVNSCGFSWKTNKGGSNLAVTSALRRCVHVPKCPCYIFSGRIFLNKDTSLLLS